jgi:hypothetical protein
MILAEFNYKVEPTGADSPFEMGKPQNGMTLL